METSGSENFLRYSPKAMQQTMRGVYAETMMVMLIRMHQPSPSMWFRVPKRLSTNIMGRKQYRQYTLAQQIFLRSFFWLTRTNEASSERFSISSEWTNLESSVTVKSQSLAMASQLKALKRSRMLLVKMLIMPKMSLMRQQPIRIGSAGLSQSGLFYYVQSCRSFWVLRTSRAAMMLINESAYSLQVSWMWQLLQEKAYEHSLHIFTKKKKSRTTFISMMARKTPSSKVSSLLKMLVLQDQPIITQIIYHPSIKGPHSPSLQLTINLNMSQERIFHSLPKKTQPTASSSRIPKTTASKMTGIDTEGCPEVSEFRMPKSMDELYVHRLAIDYGRLERPNHYYFDGPKYERVVKMTDPCPNGLELNEEMNTKRVTGISLLSAQNQFNERDTQKKGRKFQYLHERTQESRPSSSHKNCRKVKIKLAEVKAYEGMTKREGSVKRLHSRIVKMVVGGGKMTTKVITYPDNNEYLRLCGLR